MKCKKHKVDKYVPGGLSSHPDNWRCDQCDDEEEVVKTAEEYIKENPIFNMKLHEVIGVAPYTNAIRVPGGWIYNTWTEDESVVASVFVSYNEVDR